KLVRHGLCLPIQKSRKTRELQTEIGLAIKENVIVEEVKMAKKFNASQFKSKIRQLENKQRQAINNYNNAIRKYNRDMKQAVNQYNNAVRQHNARVRQNRAKIESELRRLNSQPMFRVTT